MNIEKIQKKLLEIAEKKLNEQKESAKELFFYQKYLNMSEEKQKRKVEKWLGSGHYKDVISNPFLSVSVSGMCVVSIKTCC